MKLFGGKRPAEPSGRRRPAITGDTSSRPNAAFSYYSQRPQEDNAAQRRDHSSTDNRRSSAPNSALTRHRLLIQLGLIAAVLIAGYGLYLGPSARIILIQDSSTKHFLQDAATYQQSVEATMSKSLFNRSKATIDTARIRLDLLSRYPEIKDVSVSMPLLGHQPQINIEPYQPSFIVTTTSSNAFLLDSTGRALATASQVTNIDKLGVPTIQDKSGSDVQLGSRALPTTTIAFTNTVLAALKAQQVDVSSIVLPAKAFELDVSIAETPYFVKFNLQNDPLQQAGTYLATKQRLASDKVMPSEYIDVRVPERAYYK